MLVKILRALKLRFTGELFRDDVPPACSHLARLFRVTKQRDNPRRQSFIVSGCDQVAGFIFNDRFPCAANIGRDDRAGGGHVFKN